MYSQEVTTAYIELYESSLEKLSSQYEVGFPQQPTTEVEEHRHGEPTPER